MEYLLKKHCWEIETLIFLNFLQHVHVFYLKSCCFIAGKYNVNVRSSVALFMALQVLKLRGGQTVHVQKCISEKSFEGNWLWSQCLAVCVVLSLTGREMGCPVRPPRYGDVAAPSPACSVSPLHSPSGHVESAHRGFILLL